MQLDDMLHQGKAALDDLFQQRNKLKVTDKRVRSTIAFALPIL